MNPTRTKGPTQVNHLINDQDFGDPSTKNHRPKKKTKLLIGSNPYRMVCKKCQKVNYISPSPIQETSVMFCACGHKLAIYADKDYGEKQRKLRAAQITR